MSKKRYKPEVADGSQPLPYTETETVLDQPVQGYRLVGPYPLHHPFQGLTFRHGETLQVDPDEWLRAQIEAGLIVAVY